MQNSIISTPKAYNLPPEVLSSIFLHIPVLRLYFGLRRVCQGWKALIEDLLVRYEKPLAQRAAALWDVAPSEKEGFYRVQAVPTPKGLYTHVLALAGFLPQSEAQNLRAVRVVWPIAHLQFSDAKEMFLDARYPTRSIRNKAAQWRNVEKEYQLALQIAREHWLALFRGEQVSAAGLSITPSNRYSEGINYYDLMRRLQCLESTKTAYDTAIADGLQEVAIFISQTLSDCKFPKST